MTQPEETSIFVYRDELLSIQLPTTDEKQGKNIPWPDGTHLPGITVNGQIVSITFGEGAARVVDVIALMRRLVIQLNERRPHRMNEVAIKALEDAIITQRLSFNAEPIEGEVVSPNKTCRGLRLNVQIWEKDPAKADAKLDIPWIDGALRPGVVVHGQTLILDFGCGDLYPDDVIALMRDLVYEGPSKCHATARHLTRAIWAMDKRAVEIHGFSFSPEERDVPVLYTDADLEL